MQRSVCNWAVGSTIHYNTRHTPHPHTPKLLSLSLYLCPPPNRFSRVEVFYTLTDFFVPHCTLLFKTIFFLDFLSGFRFLFFFKQHYTTDVLFILIY